MGKLTKEEREARDMHNNSASFYHDYRTKINPKGWFYNEYLEMPSTLELLGDIKGKKVLDYGCGSGIYAQLLTKKGAKILQDADKIKIFGAVGIARTFAELSTKDMLLHSNKSRKLTYFEDTNSDSILEYLRSLLFANSKKFNTRAGWKLVKPRIDFIRKFINQFEKEWKK